MQKSLKKGQIITSLLVLQAIIEKDRSLSKEVGKLQTTSKFKYATNMNVAKFMENAKIINEIFVERFSEFKNDYNSLCAKYETLDESGKRKTKGNIPLYGLDVLNIPELELGKEDDFSNEYVELRKKYDSVFDEFNSLLEEETSIDITETSSSELPDFLDYSDIEVINFMIKG